MMKLIRQRRTWILFATLVSLVVIFVVFQYGVQAATYTIVVDGSGDDTLFNLGNTAPDNTTCDLREAIAAANTYTTVGQCALPAGLLSTDDFLITFDPAVTTISLISELPQITATVEIQGGGTVTLEEAVGQIVTYGLYFARIDATWNANNSIVTGLTIQGFNQGIIVDDVSNVQIGQLGDENQIVNNITGIIVQGTNAQGTIIRNNFIGVESPLALNGNLQDGIVIRNNALSTQIVNNTIADNGRYGIYNDNSDNTIINGNNFVALGAGNGSTAIYIVSSDSISIINNNIDASGLNGVHLNNATKAVISNNLIGGVVGNAGNGVYVTNGSNEVSIINNTITNNSRNGVWVLNGSRIEIDANTIFSNGSLGIDLGLSGVTLNDLTDADGGANNLQNFPVVLMAATDTVNTYIEGNFPAQAGVYDFVYYVNNTCDPSGYGEGESILASTAGNGPGTFSEILGGTTAGQYLTVIAIDRTAGTAGNTSEFSRCFLIQDATLIVNFTPLNVTGIPGQTINFTNLSSGLITAYEWFVDGVSQAMTFNFSYTFPAPGTYTVELCATDVLNNTVCVPGTVTIQAPTATPTLVPVIPLPTLTPSQTLTSTSTLTSTATSTLTRTATNTATSTLTRTATSTATSTSTSTLTRTATSTATSTSTSTTTSTATASTTSTQTATMTGTATETVTPDIDVTVEDINVDTIEISVVNGGKFVAADVGLVIDSRGQLYAANGGSFTCVEVGGLITCAVGNLDPNELASGTFNCPDSNNVNCSGANVSVLVGGVAIAVVDEPYIIKVGEPPVAAPGSEVVYTIRVINPLTESVFDVQVTDRMPEVLEITASKAPEGVLTIKGQAISFALDELEAGATVAFTITTRVREDEVFNQIVNTACLASSANPVERCAKMSFLRTGELPRTGEVNFLVVILRWLIVPLISALMLFGVWILFRKMRRV